ncbi:carboxylesterase family protein [Streptomyces sp. NPDC056853]|uniref:carboxylesterase family protein n=1 Tax=Streptomyces sp. NPDC056853 TaxID=3345958 RepID=UPI0036B98877
MCGGGFLEVTGANPRYDGESLARDGLAVVTFNYRLGAFGFLAAPELSDESKKGSSGNYGLLDCVAALRWVRDNVADFGGDPDRVTSRATPPVPAAVGLFYRAIAQSHVRYARDPELRYLSTSYRMLADAESAGDRYAVGTSWWSTYHWVSPAPNSVSRAVGRTHAVSGSRCWGRGRTKRLSATRHSANEAGKVPVTGPRLSSRRSLAHGGDGAGVFEPGNGPLAAAAVGGGFGEHGQVGVVCRRGAVADQDFTRPGVGPASSRTRSAAEQQCFIVCVMSLLRKRRLGHRADDGVQWATLGRLRRARRARVRSYLPL